MTESQKLKRPPLSGPGSDLETWRRFAAQELDVEVSEFADMKREEVIALVDNGPKAFEGEDGAPTGTGYRTVPEADATALREAPEGVDVQEDPKDVTDALGRRTWATPVAGGYAPEIELEK